MTNVFDYLQWRGDLTFSQDPPNQIDALIFSALAYVDYVDGINYDTVSAQLLHEAAAEFFDLDDKTGRVRVKNDLKLLELAAKSKRFGQIKLTMFRKRFSADTQTQFAAVSYLLDDGSAFLAFRGTDDSLVGWKEDFNMSFQQTVPAQRLALQYVRDFAAEYIMPIRLGGHSKGGNLAVFAAARSSPMLQERMVEVYNLDGPGFTEYMIGDPGYMAILSRIHTIVPQSSVIGMLLEHEEPYTIIRSGQVSLLQHEIYSWEVIGKEFTPMEEISKGSRFLNLTIKNWIAKMDTQERNQLVDALYELLNSGEVDSAWDIFQPKNIRHYFRMLSKNEDIRKLFSGELQGLLLAVRQAKEQFDETKQLNAGD